jgi:hypothetical protein
MARSATGMCCRSSGIKSRRRVLPCPYLLCTNRGDKPAFHLDFGLLLHSSKFGRELSSHKKYTVLGPSKGIIQKSILFYVFPVPTTSRAMSTFKQVLGVNDG